MWGCSIGGDTSAKGEGYVGGWLSKGCTHSRDVGWWLFGVGGARDWLGGARDAGEHGWYVHEETKSEVKEEISQAQHV